MKDIFRWMTKRDLVALIFTLAVFFAAVFFVEPLAQWICPAPVEDEETYVATQEEHEFVYFEAPCEGCTEEQPDYSYIPLDEDLAFSLVSTCERYGVPLDIALGMIEVESAFDVDAVNPKSGCYGLFQLHPSWFPSDLSPEENMAAGIDYLAYQFGRYDGDMEAALTAYNAGIDTGDRTYASAVLDAAEKWRL